MVNNLLQAFSASFSWKQSLITANLRLYGETFSMYHKHFQNICNTRDEATKVALYSEDRKYIVHTPTHTGTGD